MFQFLAKLINGHHDDTEVVEKELAEARKKSKKVVKELAQSVEVRKQSMETLSQTIHLKIQELTGEEPAEDDDDTKIIDLQVP